MTVGLTHECLILKYWIVNLFDVIADKAHSLFTPLHFYSTLPLYVRLITEALDLQLTMGYHIAVTVAMELKLEIFWLV